VRHSASSESEPIYVKSGAASEPCDGAPTSAPNVKVPPTIHRMSFVAFALTTWLAKRVGAKLVQVAGADLD